jgi:hypothetical protein
MTRRHTSCFTALKLPLKSVEFEILATEGDKGERDFVEWAMNATARQGGMTTPMRTVVAQMGNAIAFRYAPFEKVWRVVEDGQYKAITHCTSLRIDHLRP